MNKQTAVEWLEMKLGKTIAASDWFEKAKEMEKDQIMNAVDIGFEEGSKFPEDIWWNNAEEYYNETYKGGEK
jgi:hypothetical protein